MKRIPIAAAMLLIFVDFAGAQITPDQCRSLGQATGTVTPVIGQMFEALQASGLQPTTLQAMPDELRARARAAEAARADLVGAMRAYLSAMQDLTYQLQVCSRQ